MKEFFTREASNEGIKLPLFLPSGKKTDKYLKIVGTYSDRFRQAERESMRRIADLQPLIEEDPILAEEELEKEKVKLISSLVVGWNLNEPFSQEKVLELLTNAPQVADYVNTKSADMTLFFGEESTPSENTQNGNSNSNKSRKARNKR